MKFLSILFLLLPLSTFAQDYTQAGALVDLNAAIKIDRDWSLKSKVQARQSFIQNENFEKEGIRFERKRIDLQTVIQRKFSANKVIGAGLMYRNSNLGELVRFIQQFGWLSEAYRIKLAQRIRLDETLRNSDDLEWRFRYRVGFQLPLEGFRLDKGEKYFMTEAEALAKYRQQEEGLECRFTMAYGTLFKNGNKSEVGLDYRLDGLVNSEAREHQFWLTLAYFLK